MTTRFDGDSTIYTRDVESAIDELEAQLADAKPWKVKRGEFPFTVLGEFEDEESADDFVRAEDYDTDRVVITEEDDLEEQRQELEELTEFRSDIRSSIGSYEYSEGITLTNGSSVGEDEAKEYLSDRGEACPDALERYVDWDRFIENYILDGDYATLAGEDYYDL